MNDTDGATGASRVSPRDKDKRADWWLRRGTKKRGFSYVEPGGKTISDPIELARISTLAIPPAWRRVRISPKPSSRLQAVGLDTTGRLQYIYNPRYVERQRNKKYEKIERFGQHLASLRAAADEHVRLDGFPREKVLAIMTRLINSLYFRVGSESSVRLYKTFGITTLQNRHLKINVRGELIFDFVGKSHIKHRKVLVDRELASVMTELKALGPARKLFNYIAEDGSLRSVRPSDVNAYIKAATAQEFSAKDLRTWGGTLLTAIELAEIGTADEETLRKRNVVQAIKRVAAQLGNTPAVCRASYVHPGVLRAYEQGVTLDEFRPRKNRGIKLLQADLEPEEKALLRLLSAERS